MDSTSAAAADPVTGVRTALVRLDDPVWWPEFERQFADYVTSTTRT